MAYVAVDENETEWIYSEKPKRKEPAGRWFIDDDFIDLPKGTIEKLIGKKLTWKDEPIELKEEN